MDLGTIPIAGEAESVAAAIETLVRNPEIDDRILIAPVARVAFERDTGMWKD